MLLCSTANVIHDTQCFTLRKLVGDAWNEQACMAGIAAAT
jgi:hypothetical protein